MGVSIPLNSSRMLPFRHCPPSPALFPRLLLPQLLLERTTERGGRGARLGSHGDAGNGLGEWKDCPGWGE